MAKSHYGFVGAGGVAAVHKGLQEILAARVEQQELSKKEALAREALWQTNLEKQRDFNLRQDQLGISKANLKIAQDRDARDAAAAATPRLTRLSNVRKANSPNPWTIVVPEDQPGEYEQWTAPPTLNTSPIITTDKQGRRVTALVTEGGDTKATFPYPEEPKGPGTPKPATGAQQKAFGFYERMASANKVIEATEGKLSRWDKQVLATMPEGGLLENISKYAVSDAAKQYAQAMTDFMEAGLRDASGAAINRSEFPTYRRIYQAQDSDDPDTAAQRKAARASLVRQMRIKSGSAFDQFYGDAPPDEEAAAPPRQAPAPPTRLSMGANGQVTEVGRPAPTTTLPPAPKKKTRLTVGPNGQLIEVEVK